MIVGGTGCFKTYKITNKISTDFIHISDTYSGVFISSPEHVAKDEERFINNAINTFKKNVYSDIPYQVIKSYQNDYPNVLKTRVCVTLLITDDCRQLGIIWFDDGDIDVNKSLENILDKVNWDLSEEFEY